jgi:hypothetical protein
MRMCTQPEKTRRIPDQLLEYAAGMERSGSRSFSYRERIAIERLLFLLLKDVCSTAFGYRLQGLTEVHRFALLDFATNASVNREVNRLITRVFELRVFLKSLSSANPYVQGDALSRVGLMKHSAINFIAKELRKTASLSQELKIKQKGNAEDARLQCS